MEYSVEFDNVSSGAVADAYTTFLALRAADTLGYRFRILELMVGPADDAAVDLNFSVALRRVPDVSAGGAGTAGSAVTPEPTDDLSRAAVITCGIDYVSGGVEPTTYDTVSLWNAAFNRRNSVPWVWDRNDPKIPIANRDQLIGLVGAPRTGAAAVMSGYVVFEEF